MVQVLCQKELKQWFFSQRRHLPWRNDPSPYEVWVSEIMLQQTQVSVVIPYFNRWMARFPTISALAHAQVEEVIKMWEGLGYYSRARNLHEGAKYLLEKHQGKLPSNGANLEKVKGIGPYTKGAILSFAFKQKAAAIDGNVERILSRFYSLKEDVKLASTRKKMTSLLENFLPDNESWIVMEALIELGALICQKKPQCNICPLKSHCIANKQGNQEELPIKSKGPAIQKLFRWVALIQYKDEILLRKGKKGQVMADLYEFPYLESNEQDYTSNLTSKLDFALKLIYHKPLGATHHSFTRYKAHLSSHLLSTPQRKKIPEHHWVPISRISKLPFSSGHRRLLKYFIS